MWFAFSPSVSSLALNLCMLSCAVPQLVYRHYDCVSTSTHSQYCPGNGRSLTPLIITKQIISKLIDIIITIIITIMSVHILLIKCHNYILIRAFNFLVELQITGHIFHMNTTRSRVHVKTTHLKGTGINYILHLKKIQRPFCTVIELYITFNSEFLSVALHCFFSK